MVLIPIATVRSVYVCVCVCVCACLCWISVDVVLLLHVIYSRTIAPVANVFCWLYPTLNKIYLILSYLIKDLDPNDIYAKYMYHWNPIKTSKVIVRTPNTHERAPRFIKKGVKNSGKIQIFKFSKTQDLYHVSPWAFQTYQVWRL